MGVKKYKAWFLRTSHVVVTVEAESEEDAETKAWEELTLLATQPTHINKSAWDMDSIEEIKE